MTDPLAPHVLDNLEGRARHALDNGEPSVATRLPARMLLALIVEVRIARERLAVVDTGLADAWDEGYYLDRDMFDESANPYRALVREQASVYAPKNEISDRWEPR